jgi:hypothetical protein
MEAAPQPGPSKLMAQDYPHRAAKETAALTKL